MRCRRRPGLCLLLLALAAAVSPGAVAQGAAPANYIVVLDESVVGVRAAVDRRERRDGFTARLRYAHAVKGFAARLTPSQVDRLQEDPLVETVVADATVRASAEVPLVTGEELPPAGIRRLGAATGLASRDAADGAVAVIDTGIDLTHPDLNVLPGINCVTPGTPPADDDGHGTHVAGTIGARNDGVGVVGVAPGTRLYAVKVLGANGEGSWSQVLCGIDWVTANAGALGIRVANLSLGGPGTDDGRCGRRNGDVLHRAVCRAEAAGVLSVVAAGNDGVDAAGEAPASYPEVLTVSAMADTDGRPGATGAACGGEGDDAIAAFSNFVTSAALAAHTLAAPGVCVRSTLPGGRWGGMSGTSMAAPHAAGVAALCVGEGGTPGPCAGRTPAEMISILMNAAGARRAAEGFAGDPLHAIAGRSYGALLALPSGGATPTAPALADPVSTELLPAPAEPIANPVQEEMVTPVAPPAAIPAADSATASPTLTATATLTVARRSRTMVLKRGLRVTVRCAPVCAAGTELSIRAGRRSLQRVVVQTGRTVTIRLSRSARAYVATRRTVTLALVARTDAGLRRAQIILR